MGLNGLLRIVLDHFGRVEIVKNKIIDRDSKIKKSRTKVHAWTHAQHEIRRDVFKRWIVKIGFHFPTIQTTFIGANINTESKIVVRI